MHQFGLQASDKRSDSVPQFWDVANLITTDSGIMVTTHRAIRDVSLLIRRMDAYPGVDLNAWDGMVVGKH